MSSLFFWFVYPPASEASREEANCSWRKNSHTPVYGVKEFVCLSVCLSVTNFDHNYLRTGKIEWADIFLGYLCQKVVCCSSSTCCVLSPALGCSSFHTLYNHNTILPVFASKSHFWSNSYLDSHHWQGGMKFATQISPVLN